jgi:glycosyltransferase involved in cell wall biosynthesis
MQVQFVKYLSFPLVQNWLARRRERSEQAYWKNVTAIIASGNIDQAIKYLASIRNRSYSNQLRVLKIELHLNRLELGPALELLEDSPQTESFTRIKTRLDALASLAGITLKELPLLEGKTVVQRALEHYLAPPIPKTRLSPTRVALISNKLGTGGTATQLVRIALLLSGSGFEVRLMHKSQKALTADLQLALQKANVKSAEWQEPQPAASDNARRSEQLLHALGLPQSYRGLEEAFASWEPDIIHIKGPPSFFTGVASIAAHISAKRIVLDAGSMSTIDRPDLAELQLRNRIDCATLEVLLQRSEVCLATNSDEGLSSFRSWLGDIPRATVLHNLVDKITIEAEIAAYPVTERPWPAGAIVIGSAFRFTKIKRPGLWLDIARRLARRRPDIHFAICGDGPLLEEIAAVTAQFPNFHLLGKQTPATPWIAEFDTLLLSSASEGMPNAALEAQAVGVPVVVPRVGGAAGAVKHGISGFVVEDIDNPDAYVKHLLSTLDPKWRQAASIEARQHVQGTFSAKAQLSHLVEIYGCESGKHKYKDKLTS